MVHDHSYENLLYESFVAFYIYGSIHVHVAACITTCKSYTYAFRTVRYTPSKSLNKLTTIYSECT